MRCWTSGIRSPASELQLPLLRIVIDLMRVCRMKAEHDDEHEESLD